MVKIVDRWNGKLWDGGVKPDEEHPLQLFTYQDVARLCQVQVQTVHEWVKKGMIASPKYFGYTARFTLDQLREITHGRQPEGTHVAAPSPRAKVGKKGGNAKGRWKKPTSTKHAKKRPASKPTATRAKRTGKGIKTTGNVSN